MKSIRESRHMTEDELAKRVDLCVELINDYERDVRTPRVYGADRIAYALGVPIEQLLQNLTKPLEGGIQ